MAELSWKAFESRVRLISTYIWDCNAVKETIKGINFDCVLKPKPDLWVIVEITKDMTLDKVRTDISKFSSCRVSLISDGIYPECFLVMQDEPTNTMQVTGTENKVRVLSYTSFSNLFMNYNSYFHIRSKKIFGSSVNPISGEPDPLRYTPVYYTNLKSQCKPDIDLKGIVKLINDGKRIILLGNYGTGKSRCIRELFILMASKNVQDISYPLAINLKDNWGTRKAEEILRRHFDDLGLSDDSNAILKIIESKSLILLLDGFDEIGSQAWSDDPQKLKTIRATALSGTKDLIQKCKGPIVITGREHYFKNESEMYSMLGLDPQDTVLLKCKDEFTNEEMEDYLKSLSNIIHLPIWLPKRPIICQIINSLDIYDIERIFIDSRSSVEFWKTLIINLCKREARIHNILDSDSIFKIFVKIGQLTRQKHANIGPITVSEINKAFEMVIGSYPIDDSAVMLQRLPALGRISSESNDRQFIDNYILDGLRAENLIQIINENNISVLSEKWVNPLDKLGIEIVAKYITDNQCAVYFIEYLKKNINCVNRVLLGDILTSLTFFASKSLIDMDGLILTDSIISTLNLSNSLIDNIVIEDTIIKELDISNCCCSKISFKNCYINKVFGLVILSEAPIFLKSSEIEFCIKESIISFDNKIDLSPIQMILISIIKKMFFLGTKEKQEAELLKSFGNKTDKQMATEILKILTKEKLLSRNQTKKDIIYLAKTVNKPRMKKVLVELNHSKDKVWLDVSKIVINSK